MTDDGSKQPAGVDPLSSFHFEVEFDGSKLLFQEVSGLETKFDLETVTEGGENRFAHLLPKGIKHPNLVLKRGHVARSSPFIEWCKSCLEGDLAKPIDPKPLAISLVDQRQARIVTWSMTNTYPVKWQLVEFDAMRNELAIETLELAYSTLERKSYTNAAVQRPVNER